MLSIFICDDDKDYLLKVTKIVNNVLSKHCIEMKIVLSTTNPQKIINYLETSALAGLYFLDTNYKNNVNGFNLANVIRKYDPRAFIVFITMHSEMSYMAFEYNVEALDYILKDKPQYLEQRIHFCIMKANERHNNEQLKNMKSLTIKMDGKIININFEEIIYIDSSVTIHKLELYTINSFFSFYGSLKCLQNELSNNFIRCHKSFIINQQHIKTFDKKNKEIIMINGKKIPISMKSLKVLFEHY